MAWIFFFWDQLGFYPFPCSFEIVYFLCFDFIPTLTLLFDMDFCLENKLQVLVFPKPRCSSPFRCDFKVPLPHCSHYFQIGLSLYPINIYIVIFLFEDQAHILLLPSNSSCTQIDYKSCTC